MDDAGGQGDVAGFSIILGCQLCFHDGCHVCDDPGDRSCLIHIHRSQGAVGVEVVKSTAKSKLAKSKMVGQRWPNW